MTRVAGVTAAASRTGSSRQRVSPRSSGTKTGFAPASRIAPAKFGQAGEGISASSPEATVILAAICSVLLGMIDNFVRPLMISGRAEMSMLLIFIGVLGGIEAFGLLGVVLGPVIIAIAATLLNVYVPSVPPGNSESKASGKKTAAVLE